MEPYNKRWAATRLCADKLHRMSFEKSRGSDKKYLGKMVVADGRMADVVDIGRWRNSGCGGCGRLWWRKQLAL